MLMSMFYRADAQIVSCPGFELCAGASDTSACLSYNALLLLGGSWSSSNTAVATVNSSGVVTGVSAGTASISFSYFLLGLHAVGAVVTVNPRPSASPTSNSPICAGATLTFDDNSTNATTYRWAGPAGFSSTLSDPTRTSAGTTATGTYTVFLTSNKGCKDSFTVSAIVDSFPTATVSSNTPVCQGATLSFTTAGATVSGRMYAWSGPVGYSSTVRNPSLVTSSTSQSGTYTMTATSQYGCATIYTTAATVKPLPLASPTSNSPICAESTLSFMLHDTGSNSYAWAGPGGYSSTARDPALTSTSTAQTGTYSVSVTSGVGCGTLNYTVSATVYALPSVNISYDTLVCAGGTLRLYATGDSGNVYVWSGPGTFTSTVQNPTRSGVTDAVNGVYSAVATTYLGCNKTYTLPVTIATHPYAATIDEVFPVAGTTVSVHSYCGSAGLTVGARTVPDLSGAGMTYTWYGPSGTVGTTSTFSPSLTLSTTSSVNIYTLSATVNGCDERKMDTVVIPPINGSPCDYFSVNGYRTQNGLAALTACTDCDSIQPFVTIVSSSLTAANIADGGNYYLVNSAYLMKDTLKNVNVLINKGKTITVPAGTTVTVDHCHLFASNTNWWGGLFVEQGSSSTGHLHVRNNTLIENAGGTSLTTMEGMFPTAIGLKPGEGYYSAGMDDIIECDGVILNKNYIGLSLYQYQPSVAITGAGISLPFSVAKTVFCNKEFGTMAGATSATSFPFVWPDVDSLLAVTGSGVSPIRGVDAYLNRTDAGQGQAGMFLQNVGANSVLTPGDTLTPATYSYNVLLVGDSTDASRMNFFDSLSNGIQIQSSNVQIVNAEMRNVSGKGISIGNGVNVCGIGGVRSSSTHCRLYNCATGIDIGGAGSVQAWDVVCRNADIWADRAGGMVAPIVGVHLSPIGTHNSYVLRDNDVYNYDYGVQVQYGGGSALSKNGWTYIIANTIAGKNSTHDSESMTIGIDWFEGRTSATGAANGYIYVDSNTVTGAKTGINLTSKAEAFYVRYNTISLKSYAGVSPTGINASLAYYTPDMKGNSITGFGYNCSPQTTGIRLNKCGLVTDTFQLYCNTVADVNVGLEFRDTSVVRVRNNVMARNQKGMMLNTGALIGAQGSMCSPADNQWVGGNCVGCTCGSFPGWSGSGIYATYSNSANAVLSPIYCRYDSVTYATYKPASNGGIGGTNYSLSNSSLLNSSTLCLAGLSAPDDCSALAARGVANAGDTGVATGVDAAIISGDLTLYPNPGKGTFVLEQPGRTGACDVWVLQADGRMVYSAQIVFAGGVAALQMPDVAAGGYLLYVRDTKSGQMQSVLRMQVE